MKRPLALKIVLAVCEGHDSPQVREAVAALTPKSKPSSPAVFSARGLAFANWFRSTLAADVRLSDHWQQQWAKCYDDMIDLDKRTVEQIAAVCQWARANEFWKANFQTPLKLRQRKDGVTYFDRFAAAMGTKGPATRRAPQSRGYEIEPGRGPKAVSAMELLQTTRAHDAQADSTISSGGAK